jgi:hypothetical protein
VAYPAGSFPGHKREDVVLRCVLRRGDEAVLMRFCHPGDALQKAEQGRLPDVMRLESPSFDCDDILRGWAWQRPPATIEFDWGEFITSQDVKRLSDVGSYTRQWVVYV